MSNYKLFNINTTHAFGSMQKVKDIGLAKNQKVPGMKLEQWLSVTASKRCQYITLK